MDTTLSMTSHKKHLEVGQLTNLRWQQLQLVANELKEKGGDQTIASQRTPWTLPMTSHRELLEGGELINLRWQRSQLVFIELKEKGGDQTIVSQRKPWTSLSP